MTRVSLLSFAAFGLVAGAILAGCAPSEAQTAADNAAAANSGSNGANAVDAANNATTPSTPTNDANAGTTNGVTNGSTAQAGNEASNEGIDLSKSEPMVPFKLVSTKGQTLTNESLKGKVVLIDFWATWCGPCKAASPTMEKLYKTYGGQGLEIIGANTFEQSPELKKEAAAAYAKEHGYTYTFTPNSDELAAKMGVENIPCFVFIDKKGNVRQIATGFHPTDTAPEFEAAVKKLLAEA